MTDQTKDFFSTISDFWPISASSDLNHIAIITRRFLDARMGHHLDVSYSAATYFFKDSKKARNKVITTLSEAGFIIRRYGSLHTLAILEDTEHNCVKCCIEINTQNFNVHIEINGDKETCKFWRAHFDEAMVNPGTIVVTWSVDEGNKFIAAECFITKEESRLSHESFYPFMHLPLEDYFNEFMKSDSRVLVLVGPPGTGKSTFLRTLILNHAKNAGMAYSKAALEHPMLVTKLSSQRYDIIGLEDVDLFISSREAGNPIMSSFLNATEGVVNKATNKVVFSTNLATIDKIDPALLRRGRCFDVIEFRLLTVDEARTVETAMGLPPQDLSSKQKWSLAEILNPPQDFLQMSNRTKKSIGFN